MFIRKNIGQYLTLLGLCVVVAITVCYGQFVEDPNRRLPANYSIGAPSQEVIVTNGGINNSTSGVPAARTDALIEVQHKSFPLMSFFNTANPGNTTDEGGITFYARDSAGVAQKKASISALWNNTTAGSQQGILRFNATTIGASDQMFLTAVGGNGTAFYGATQPGNLKVFIPTGIFGDAASPTGDNALNVEGATDATVKVQRGAGTATAQVKYQTGPSTNDWIVGTAGANGDMRVFSFGTSTNIETWTKATGVITPNGYTFATLPAVPGAGGYVYCSNCTTAATCAGSGTGHMAVSNGTAWTCQ